MPKVLAVADEVSSSLERALTRGKLDVDLVISCGDLPYDYLEFLIDALDVPLVYVHGNHDRPVHTETRIIEAPAGARELEGRLYNIQGLLLAGLGGSPRYSKGAYQFSEREMAWRVRKLELKLWWARLRGQQLDVLVTHAPPRGVHDNDDPAHRGFACFVPFVQRWRPRFLLHGHAAPRPGLPSETRVGATLVIYVRGHRILDIPHAVP